MRVFVSHTENDSAFARDLGARLASRGFDVWDPYVHVAAGANWYDQVAYHLRRAEAMVVLLSEHSTRSRWLVSEIEYALGQQRFKDRLVPVLVEPTEDVPWILRTLQMVDSRGDATRAADRVARALRRPPAGRARAAG